MTSPANLSFETAGASPGLADSWTDTETSSEYVGSFADSGGPYAVENYSVSWPGEDGYALAFAGGTVAQFDGDFISPPKNIEQYGRWLGPFFFTVISGGTAGQFDGALTIEDYSLFWTGSYVIAISGSPDIFEDYSTGWPNDPYATEITSGTAAAFNTPSGTSTMESYENVFQDVPFVVDLSNNIFVCANPHGLTSNDRGEIISTGKRPGGVPAGANVFVDVVTSTTFRVSAAPGPGSPVTLTDVGFGEHVFKADKTKYWTDVD